MPDPVQINVDHASDDENVPEVSTATSGAGGKKPRPRSLSVTVSQAPDDRTSNRDTGFPGRSSAGHGHTQPTMIINTTARPNRERSLSATVREDGRVSPRGSRANSTANSPSGSPLPSPGHSPRLHPVVLVQRGSNEGNTVESSSGGLLSPGLHKTSSRGNTSPKGSRRGSEAEEYRG